MIRIEISEIEYSDGKNEEVSRIGLIELRHWLDNEGRIYEGELGEELKKKILKVVVREMEGLFVDYIDYRTDQRFPREEAVGGFNKINQD